MHKHIIIGMVLVFAIVISGCSLRKPEEQTVHASTAAEITGTPSETQTEATEHRFAPSETRRIDRSETINGKTISIHATVEPIDVSNLQSVTMETDQDAYWQMFENERQVRYPDSADSDVTYENRHYELKTGEKCVLSLADMTSGRMYFLDLEKDLNGWSDPDEEGIYFVPYYITTKIPQGMTLTADEAAQNLIAEIKPYTDFDFIPWNITKQTDYQAKKGYYEIKLQQCYNNIPIYDVKTILPFYGAYSEEGLMTCQGTVFLREKSSRNVEASFELESAVDSFFKRCPIFSYGDEIVCEKISLGYVVTTEGGGMTLSPAWVFACEDTKTGENGFTDYYSCGFFMEDGSFKLNQY